MNDQQLGLLIDSWLKESDCPPGDVGRSTAQVESRLRQTPQQLSFELHGIDKRPDRQAVYADHTYRPVGETLPLPDLPTDFPTGWFIHDDGGGQGMLFEASGRMRSNTMSGHYVVNGNLWTDARNSSTIVDPIPGTYYWDWDGKELTFDLWGEDDNAYRTNDLGNVYVRDEEAEKYIGYRALLLSDPRLDIWVRVELAKSDDGRHKATATIDGEPLGEGVGDTVPEAVKAALEPLGEPYASDMADNVES